uniref:Transcription factor protein n=1 Tax=Ciona intestinalis TaxID=7719 RepID=Q4H3S0_CIOIN|nr:transcription factor protein [Ciona intestinalis]BAE06357.1 transcription factor protein [Ciona intestinalis]|eukprot:NP_001071674.1 transcription factor protein [Ciona intestinalis]
MTSLQTGLFDDKSCVDDLLDSNYLKLPFCDEDLKDFKELAGQFWGSEDLEDDTYDIQYHHGLASPASESYCLSPTSSTSSGQTMDNTHSLLNERPDTPLMAVKFEDFSNDYGLNAIGFPSFENDTDGQEDSIGLNLTMEPVDMIVSKPTSDLKTGSERTYDCSFASNVTNNNMITISKAEDGTALIKQPNKETPMEFSVCSETPSVEVIDTQYITDKPTSIKQTTKPTADELIDISDLIKIPTVTTAQKLKLSPTQTKLATNTFTHKAQIQIPTAALQTILKNGRLVTTRLSSDITGSKIKIKNEIDNDLTLKLTSVRHDLPPTPPSSASSDTEGSNSPRSVGTSGSPVCHLRVSPHSTSLTSQLISSTQRYTQSHGTLMLTEDEKRTLVAEGYPVPAKLPLTKSEEKSLKKVRRKIKNKISAQESRRKKKEYVETLEKRMDVYNRENTELRHKLDSLESSNRSLLSQLKSLQVLVAGSIPKPSRTVNTQTSSCLMMLVLCFAIFLGGWFPHLSPINSGFSAITSFGKAFNNQPEPNWRSRVLMPEVKCDGCHGYDKWSNGDQSAIDKNADAIEPGDTYDEPAGGGSTTNDTGDETSKIIANTMEARTAADILASRKVAVQGSKMKVVGDVDGPYDVTKKVIASHLVAE